MSKLSTCEENDMNEEKPEDLAMNYAEANAEAIKKGWDLPRVAVDRGGMKSWLRYWYQMGEHDMKVANGDKDPGRPVVPHRSA